MNNSNKNSLAPSTLRAALAGAVLVAFLAPMGCLATVTGNDEEVDGDLAETSEALVLPNLALGRPTSQSSTYAVSLASAVPGSAVDGNTDGNFGNGSVTHTDNEAGAWWQVDLQSVRSVGDVVLWNRTDCCSDRLSNFDLIVSDDNINWQWYGYPGVAPAQVTFAVNRTARYVKVRLRGTNPLSLAEVQVFASSPGVPVMGNAHCNDTVQLKSWKGDYLHRPDGAQGVTTWNAGGGSVWTLRCYGGGKVGLESWKGDYLHRPDSPQGVTTWNVGIGNEWDVVPVAGANVMLRSWKGDYLHRPDSAQGVTTWDQGTWTVEPTCAPHQVSLDGVTCVEFASLTILQQAQRYAPQVWMHEQESYFPSSTDDFLPNVHETTIDNAHFYVTNQALGCDSCTDPPFLDGKNPAQSAVPVYAEVVNRTQNGQPTNVTDVIYWMFYPYNNGKRVCVGAYFDNYCPQYCPWPLSGSCCVPRIDGCVGGYSTFGNHVGDWEHVSIRFVDGQPIQVALSQHDHGQVFTYGDPALQLSSGRPVVYAAKGSHGLYPDAARHTYKNLPNGDTLNDDTSKGILWETQQAVVAFSPQAAPQTGSLAWLNYTGRWGNPKSGCSPSESISGECVLNSGPMSILPRSVSNPELAPID